MHDVFTFDGRHLRNWIHEMTPSRLKECYFQDSTSSLMTTSQESKLFGLLFTSHRSDEPYNKNSTYQQFHSVRSYSPGCQQMDVWNEHNRDTGVYLPESYESSQAMRTLYERSDDGWGVENLDTTSPGRQARTTQSRHSSQRLAANLRERRRMHSINDAFEGDAYSHKFASSTYRLIDDLFLHLGRLQHFFSSHIRKHCSNFLP